jgi:hypothetical protein
MTMNQRTVWATLIAFPLVGAVYCAVILSRAASMPVEDVSWVTPMIWSMASVIAVVILGTIASAIASGVAAGVRGDEPEFEEGDIRDKQIDLLGDARAYTVYGFGGLATLILLMLDADPLWVASTLFMAGIVSGTVAAAIKVRAYRTGI